MAKTYSKAKGRRESGRFHQIPDQVLTHDNFSRLGGSATKLLMQMASQLRYGPKGGTTNNGDLTAVWSIMKERGWKSKWTLERARDELLYYGFLMISRQGGLHLPSLYAITWLAIDECKGKLDVAATAAPPGNWKEVKPAGGWRQTCEAKRVAKTKAVPRKLSVSAPETGAMEDVSQAIAPETGSINAVSGASGAPKTGDLLRSTIGGGNKAVCEPHAGRIDGAADELRRSPEPEREQHTLSPGEVLHRIRGRLPAGPQR